MTINNFLFSQFFVAGSQRGGESSGKPKTTFGEFKGELDTFKDTDENAIKILKRGDKKFKLFKTTIEFLMENIKVILETKIICYSLAIYHKRTNITLDEFLKFHNNLVEKQRSSNFFQYLHLHYEKPVLEYRYSSFLSGFATLLHIANDDSMFSLGYMQNLVQLYIKKVSQIYGQANSIGKLKSLYNLNIKEEISSKDVEYLVVSLPILRQLKIERKRILNVQELDELRIKRKYKGTLTIYLPDEVDKASWRDIRGYQLKSITTQPFESYNL